MGDGLQPAAITDRDYVIAMEVCGCTGWAGTTEHPTKQDRAGASAERPLVAKHKLGCVLWVSDAGQGNLWRPNKEAGHDLDVRDGVVKRWMGDVKYTKFVSCLHGQWRQRMTDAMAKTLDAYAVIGTPLWVYYQVGDYARAAYAVLTDFGAWKVTTGEIADRCCETGVDLAKQPSSRGVGTVYRDDSVRVYRDPLLEENQIVLTPSAVVLSVDRGPRPPSDAMEVVMGGTFVVRRADGTTEVEETRETLKRQSDPEGDGVLGGPHRD